MPRFHVKGSITYTHRTDNEADIDSIVEAATQEQAEEIAVDMWVDDHIFIYDDIEIEQQHLATTREDESTYPAWKEMQAVGVPSLFEYAKGVL